MYDSKNPIFWNEDRPVYVQEAEFASFLDAIGGLDFIVELALSEVEAHHSLSLTQKERATFHKDVCGAPQRFLQMVPAFYGAVIDGPSGTQLYMLGVRMNAYVVSEIQRVLGLS